MPIVAAILGAIVTGLVYWLTWGKGLEYIDHTWRETSNRRRDAKRRTAALELQQLAAVRSITDARDAAHNGPTDQQEQFIAYAARRLTAQS